MHHPWLKLQCPDCATDAVRDGGAAYCPRCFRRFEERDGILHLLPSSIEQEALKRREKEGWGKLVTTDYAAHRDYYLNLPFVEENLPQSTHYREAARQFRPAARYLAPLAGKRGLDLGGQFGWAAWQFSSLGAQMALADFNDGAVSGLGAAKVYLDAGARFDRLCVDAERLPLADAQFDFVFCCAFLHHLTDPLRAVAHVGRVLRPGGVFIAINESFLPFWMTRRQALARCQRTRELLNEGINEQVFSMGEYASWFREAGLSFEVVNPRWDEVEPGRALRNRGLARADYAPEILANRAGGAGALGAAVRSALRLGLWRPLAHPALFHFLRPLLISGTQKFRLLIGRKSA